MSFEIHSLEAHDFSPLFELSNPQLEARRAKRMTVQSKPGYPCRVSLADAEVGESVILVNYEHLPTASPYRSSHAIFVREGAKSARPRIDEIPEVMRIRLLSVRAFNAADEMVDADVVHGSEVSETIERLLADRRVSYLHLHYAKPGCFAARVTRAGEPSS